MDITTAAFAASSQQLAYAQNAVQIQVLKKVLDIQSQQGAQLALMMQQAAGLGRGVDFQA